MNALKFLKIDLDKNKDQLLVFGLLAIYLLTAIIWQFLTDAPWDDDCITRYYNAKEALNNPGTFISIWDRSIIHFVVFYPVPNKQTCNSLNGCHICNKCLCYVQSGIKA